MTHNFNDKLAEGQAIERELDAYFRDQYFIAAASPADQRAGIDRLFRDKQTNRLTAIEYKADFQAGKTGNAFIETVSVDAVAKAGWALSSESAYIFYFVASTRKLYIVDIEVLRRWLPLWEDLFEKRYAQNEGYRTYGVLVPLEELAGIAKYILEIPAS